MGKEGKHMLFGFNFLINLVRAVVLALVMLAGIFVGKKLRDRKTARMQQEEQEVNDIMN